MAREAVQVTGKEEAARKRETERKRERCRQQESCFREMVKERECEACSSKVRQKEERAERHMPAAWRARTKSVCSAGGQKACVQRQKCLGERRV